MEKLNNYTTADLISQLRKTIDPFLGALLVGGVVRDQLTNTTCHDIDLIVPRETRRIAREVADMLGGKFFPLDEERGMYRIILTNEVGQMDMVDFSRLQAGSLEEDLRMRDFTVNAIAVKLHEPDAFVDPLNGRVDLKDRILRSCSETSLEKDPVRVIRAARLSLAYNLQLAPGLISKIRAAGSLLIETSAERQRDEIFKILDGDHPASAIRILDSFGVLSLLFPALEKLKRVEQSLPHTMDVFEHTLASVDQFKRILDLFISPQKVLSDGGNLTFGLLAGKLGGYRENIADHFRVSLNPFRSRRSLDLLAILLHDIGKPSTRTVGTNGRTHFYQHENVGGDMVLEIARSMALSEAETDALSRMVSMHMRPRLYSKDDRLPTRKSIYRFYRQAKNHGVDACLLSLADYLAKSEYPPDQVDWEVELDRIGQYLEGWFNQKINWVEPIRLVRGEEIMAVFQIPPGQMVGTVLDAIQEAHAAGEITTHKEAMEYAKIILFNSARESDD
jgi:tRNA nucleotidyltransferase/poly(A) polymerase